MSRDPFFDAIRDQLLPDATDTEIESLFGQYLGAQPEPVFIAHIAGDPKPQGSKRYVGEWRCISDEGITFEDYREWATDPDDDDTPAKQAWRQRAGYTRENEDAE
nr:MAG TPA: hypothetical protein [Caudoviricetes sp.]